MHNRKISPGLPGLSGFSKSIVGVGGAAMNSKEESRGKQKGLLDRLFPHKPAKPGESFGVPGQGSSRTIAIVTVVTLFILWFVITATGLVKPLFLPSPKAVWDKF